MINFIKSSNKFYYKRIDYRVLGVLSSILILYTILDIVHVKEFYVTGINVPDSICKNGWDLYNSLYMNSSTSSYILLFLSLYFLFVCFNDKNQEYFLKIRSNSSLAWFISKIISIFLFNIIIITLHTIITVIIGSFSLGTNTEWSTLTHYYGQYTRFYSPIKLALINIIIYSFFITFLSEIIGILILKINNRKLVILITLIGILLDRYEIFTNEVIINFTKYFSLKNYINFGNRIFYLDDINSYFTIKQSVLYSIILLVLFTFIIIINSKKLKVKE